MTSLTETERGLIARALFLAGRADYSEAALASAQAHLCAMVRLVEQVDGRAAHLARMLEASTRPAGWTDTERDAYRALRLEVERMRFRWELDGPDPVPYTLTDLADSQLGQWEEEEQVKASA